MAALLENYKKTVSIVVPSMFDYTSANHLRYFLRLGLLHLLFFLLLLVLRYLTLTLTLALL